MDKRKLKRNIKLLYSFRIFGFIIFFAPIIVIFFEDNGLNMTQIMLLQTIFAVTLLLLEVPSGFLADRVGRRFTLIAGSVGLLLGVIVYSVGYDFYVFAIAEVLFAVGVSLVSGSDIAMLYDTLIALGREDEYKKIEGNAYSLNMLAMVIATVIGGFAGAWFLRLPFYMTVATFTLLVPFSIMLTEPPREKGGHHRGQLYYFYKIHRFALYKNKEVRWLILLGALLTAGLTVHFWLYQPYFEFTGVPLIWFGVIFGVLNLIAAVSSKFAPQIEKLLRKRLSVISLPTILAASPILMALIVTPFSFLLILPGQFVRGFATPILNDYLNKHVWSDKRATVMSIRSLISRGLFAVSAPVIGYVVDVYNIQVALISLGIAVFAIGFLLIIFMLKDKVI